MEGGKLSFEGEAIAHGERAEVVEQELDDAVGRASADGKRRGFHEHSKRRRLEL
jgi:hypothetical protein